MRAWLARLIVDPRVRFLLVGGVNTLFAYGVFVIAELTIGRHLGYLVSLYVSYAIAIVLAFVLHRRFTFKVVGSRGIVLDFVRFQLVYIVILVINSIALPLLVEGLGWSPLVAQAVVIAVTTVMSYVAHRWFSFRRPAADASRAESPGQVD